MKVVTFFRFKVKMALPEDPECAKRIAWEDILVIVLYFVIVMTVGLAVWFLFLDIFCSFFCFFFVCIRIDRVFNVIFIE